MVLNKTNETYIKLKLNELEKKNTGMRCSHWKYIFSTWKINATAEQPLNQHGAQQKRADFISVDPAQHDDENAWSRSAFKSHREWDVGFMQKKNDRKMVAKGLSFIGLSSCQFDNIYSQNNTILSVVKFSSPPGSKSDFSAMKLSF